MDTLFQEVRVRGRRCDVRVADGVVTHIGPGLPVEGARVITGGDGALLPGLHEHHCHLLACAAAADSVSCGPPQVRTAAHLHDVLSSAATEVGATAWIRGVGYDESVAGALDRAALDRSTGAIPTRVQHRGGSVWYLNSAAITALDLDITGPPGTERDAAGYATGRLWRADRWLGEHVPSRAAPDLGALGRALASYGVTGVTDATPELTESSTELLLGAHESGVLPQRLTVLGAANRAMRSAGVLDGPRKIVVSDHELPALDELIATIRSARAATDAPGTVAVHSVTRESLFLTLTALAEVGTLPGDRIEHAAVAPDEAIDILRELRLVVVTQPSLLALRGDDYLERAEPGDREILWRYGAFLAAGVPVYCSGDAPYGALDPWVSIAAATRRTTPKGRVVGAQERVSAETALSAYFAHPELDGRARTVTVGAPADLVLLDRTLEQALHDPDSRCVQRTFISGREVFDRENA
ncbi:amidohydrolase family protein [Nocardia callitridis]|uniref:amidohydrolase family protein n=1 Tax=Nocardia callitridis TaxID=648753 RepID=UPI0031EB9CC3